MNQAIAPITVIIDECLPFDSFRSFLEQRGHLVYGVGTGFPSGSPDQSILAVAESMGAVVFSKDKHWKRLIGQAPTGTRASVRRAGRVLFNCNHAIALQRLPVLIEDIEREHAAAVSAQRQLMIRITGTTFMVEK